MTKQEAIEKYKLLESVRTEAALRIVLPTLAHLREFYDNVKNFSWPASYGESPWDWVSWIAYLATTSEPVTNTHVLESEAYRIAQSYRNDTHNCEKGAQA